MADRIDKKKINCVTAKYLKEQDVEYGTVDAEVEYSKTS